MKPLLAALLFLLPFPGHALSRKTAIPILHSVLDKKPEAPVFNFVAAPLPAPRFADGHDLHSKSHTSAEQWRRRGIGFTIAGGVVLAGSGAALVAINAENRRQSLNGVTDSNVIYYAGAVVLGLIGLVFLAIGLPIWLYHVGK